MVSTNMGDIEIQSVVYLLGAGIGHSVAPPVHNYVASSLGCPWKFEACECSSIDDAVSLIRQPGFAGAIVTMPYKKKIMSYLDRLDDIAVKLGACNNIYIASDGHLCGTNTDWIGVAGCLREGVPPKENRPALVIGAGGAARAAIHAIATPFKCSTVYIVNRDDREVSDLKEEVEANYPGLEVIHVETSRHAESLSAPYYVVGTIPDTEPVSPQEFEVWRTVESFFCRAQETGVLVDMCYKPRRTRLLKLAERSGWKSVEGIAIIGYQLEKQYRLWCGDEAVSRLPLSEAWKILYEAAERSPAINF